MLRIVNVKDLREALAELPDDAQVTMLDEFGGRSYVDLELSTTNGKVVEAIVVPSGEAFDQEDEEYEGDACSST